MPHRGNIRQPATADGRIHMGEPRTYEFACHFTTQLDEATVPALWQEVIGLIQRHGGTVSLAQEPQKQRLSYPILHQRQSFFGWAQFTLSEAEGSPSLLAELAEWARLHPQVLRHIVLKLEPESDKRAAKQAQHLERKAAKQAKEGAQQKKTAVETPSEDKGKLEKQLEDILGNL